jgi:hypothetical protein
MEEAGDRVNRYVIDKGESSKVICFNQKSYVFGFRSAKGEMAVSTISQPV